MTLVPLVKKLQVRKCIGCGRSFECYHRTQKFCNDDDCRMELRSIQREREITRLRLRRGLKPLSPDLDRVCGNCGESFHARQSNQVYCWKPECRALVTSTGGYAPRKTPDHVLESFEELEEVVEKDRTDLQLLDEWRPRTRADCERGVRPCPWVSCRHNLVLDVSSVGSVKIYWPVEKLDKMPDSCALDVAERGPQTLEVVGECFGLTRERIRQVEEMAMRKVRRTCAESKDLLNEEGINLWRSVGDRWS